MVAFGVSSMFKHFSTLLVLTGSLMVSAVSTAHAGTLHRGWSYSIDAQDDGSGGPDYEIGGLAVKETADSIYFAITGGTALTGVETPDAEDGNIGWGDLLLNFTDAPLNQTNDLWGIRFAATNDSGVTDVGLFREVTAQSVAAENNGYDSLSAYYDVGYGRRHTLGDLTTESAALDYVGETTPVLSSIQTGQWVGAIDFLSDQDAAKEGLDFTHFDTAGDEIHTFRVERTLLPGGDFIATLFLECLNDGVALLSAFQGKTPQRHLSQDVPEPLSLSGLLLVGLIAGRILGRHS